MRLSTSLLDVGLLGAGPHDTAQSGQAGLEVRTVPAADRQDGQAEDFLPIDGLEPRPPLAIGQFNGDRVKDVAVEGFEEQLLILIVQHWKVIHTMKHVYIKLIGQALLQLLKKLDWYGLLDY